jgi:hypothetical protein
MKSLLLVAFSGDQSYNGLVESHVEVNDAVEDLKKIRANLNAIKQGKALSGCSLLWMNKGSGKLFYCVV